MVMTISRGMLLLLWWLRRSLCSGHGCQLFLSPHGQTSSEMVKWSTACSRLDFHLSHESWIIKYSVAYVAQIPWLEDASVKQNILYGLPFDQIDTVSNVLGAAALVKDLEILTGTTPSLVVQESTSLAA